MRRKIIRILWTIFFSFFGLIILAVIFIENGWIGNMPDLDALQSPISRYASQVISADGKLLGTWSRNENRVYVEYDSISPYLYKALKDTEDERFLEHSGIDARALGRAIIKRGILGQKNAGGGSTITQQLAKQLYSETASSTVQRLFQKPIEWVIAVELERYYTKEEIMTLYLNYFDFLHNAVGIKTAARVYFGKAPYNLTLAESALLIGMCKNPSYYNPVRYPERCRERRNVVLQQMVKSGDLTEEECERTSQEPVALNFRQVDHKEGAAPYLREYLRQIMMADKPVRSNYRDWQRQQYYSDSIAWETDPLFGWCKKNKKRDGSNYDIYVDGLKIYTTIDTRMQEYAEKSMYEHLALKLQPIFNGQRAGSKNFPYSNRLSDEQVNRIMQRSVRASERYCTMKANGCSESEIQKAFNTPTKMTVFTYRGERDTTITPLDSIRYYKTFLRSGLVSIDPTNGYVKAYVGGINFTYFQYDMAMQGRRQVGSTMKPLVYALAMEDGYTPEDKIYSGPKTYNGWKPRSGYGGQVPISWGLAHSNNAATADLMYKIDPNGKKLERFLHECGVANPDINPSIVLCLGTCDITVGEMASAYTAFPNKGIRCAPILVSRIEDSEGNPIAEFLPRMNDVISEESSYYMIEMMRGVVERGTGRGVHSYVSAQVAGKTGTTNNNSDAWFIGYIPQLVTACWVGGEDRDIRLHNGSVGQGAAAALPIWGKYMKRVFEDKRLGYDPTEKFDMGEKKPRPARPADINQDVAGTGKKTPIRRPKPHPAAPAAAPAASAPASAPATAPAAVN